MGFGTTLLLVCAVLLALYLARTLIAEARRRALDEHADDAMIDVFPTRSEHCLICLMDQGRDAVMLWAGVRRAGFTHACHGHTNDAIVFVVAHPGFTARARP